MATEQETGLVHVRSARFEEIDEVSLLLKAAYREYEKVVPPDAWKEYVLSIQDVRGRWPDSDQIIAEIDRTLVGAVTLYLEGSASLPWPSGWAGVRLLGVHPNYRGRGVGRLLMEECIRRCRQKGVKVIGLHTTVAMDVARRMYEKMGFTRVTEYDFLPAPGVVVMAYRFFI